MGYFKAAFPSVVEHLPLRPQNVIEMGMPCQWGMHGTEGSEWAPIVMSRAKRDEILYRIIGYEVEIHIQEDPQLSARQTIEITRDAQVEEALLFPGIDQSISPGENFRCTFEGGQEISSPDQVTGVTLQLFARRLLGNDIDTQVEVLPAYARNGDLWNPSLFLDITMDVDAGTEFRHRIASYLTPDDLDPTTEIECELVGFGPFTGYVFSDVAAEAVGGSIRITPIRWFTHGGKWDEDTGARVPGWVPPKEED